MKDLAGLVIILMSTSSVTAQTTSDDPFSGQPDPFGPETGTLVKPEPKPDKLKKDPKDLFRKPWSEAAKNHVSEGAFAALKKDGLAIVDEGSHQIFSIYVHNGLPFFITSDAILHAFHVMMEESLVRLEMANSFRLRKFLELAITALHDGLGRIEKPTEKSALGERKITILISVAARLLGSDLNGIENTELENTISAEVERVIDASEATMPEWLGNPRPEFLAIDYRTFKPSGPYQRSKLLSDYYRAVKWLQSVPLWMDRDEDYLGLYILAEGLFPKGHFDREGELDWETIAPLVAIDDLFGKSLNIDFHSFSSQISYIELEGKSEAIWLNQRKKIISALEDSFNRHGSSSRLRFQNADRSAPGIVMVSGKQLVDNELFSGTVGSGIFKDRSFPSGLEMAVLANSDFAKSILVERGENNVVDFQTWTVIEPGYSIYGEWIKTMGVLQTGIPENAPDVFRTKAWERKTCETTLASWAHMRHAASLHSPANANFHGSTRVPPGFVEPNPEFFRSLSGLCEALESHFEEAGAFKSNAGIQSMEYRKYADLFRDMPGKMILREKPKGRDEKHWGGWVLDYDGFTHYGDYKFATKFLQRAGIPEDRDKLYSAPAPEQVAETVRALDKIADELESGKRLPFRETKPRNLRGSFRSLASLCRDLELICVKQLHSIELSRREEGMLRRIGPILGRLEGYHGNSWLGADDDAPRISEIYHNPRVGQRFHIASGRPATIYLLYPFEGKPVLCRGGVMTYYETKSGKRLDNTAWKKLLDSDSPPMRPDWALPMQQRRPKPKKQ